MKKDYLIDALDDNGYGCIICGRNTLSAALRVAKRIARRNTDFNTVGIEVASLGKDGAWHPLKVFKA